MLRRFTTIRSQSSLRTAAAPCQLAVLGAGGVGKTSLVRRFLHNQFRLDEEPTVGDSFCEHVMFPNGLTRQIQIVDTAGSLSFPAEKHVIIKSYIAFLIVCEAGNVESINAASAILRDITRIKGNANAARVTVCINKSDQGSTDNFLECSRLAERLLSVKPIVASAKTGCNVLEVFYMALWPESMRGSPSHTYSLRARQHLSLRRISSDAGGCRTTRKHALRKRISLTVGSNAIF